MNEKCKYKKYDFLTIAGILNAFGITFFLYPVNLYDSGISGTSMLLAQITPDYLSLSDENAYVTITEVSDVLGTEL